MLRYAVIELFCVPAIMGLGLGIAAIAGLAVDPEAERADVHAAVASGPPLADSVWISTATRAETRERPPEVNLSIVETPAVRR